MKVTIEREDNKTYRKPEVTHPLPAGPQPVPPHTHHCGPQGGRNNADYCIQIRVSERQTNQDSCSCMVSYNKNKKNKKSSTVNPRSY